MVPIMAEAASVSTILTDVGTVVTQAMTWAGNVVTFITSNPLIMVACRSWRRPDQAHDLPVSREDPLRCL